SAREGATVAKRSNITAPARAASERAFMVELALPVMRAAELTGDRWRATCLDGGMAQARVAFRRAAEMARASPLFEGVFLGGFECSCQRLEDGRRLDLLARTRHDELAREDYE